MLAAAYDRLRREESAGGRPLPRGLDELLPGAEWLLDNYYVIADQIAEVRVDLPAHYYTELPKLTDGPLNGYPRIYALGRALVAHSDAVLDAERIVRFVRAYQAALSPQAPLTLGELWSVPIMLRLSLIETLAHLVVAGGRVRAAIAVADRWADALLAALDAHPGRPLAVPPALVDQPAVTDLTVAARLLSRLRDQGAAVAPVIAWLGERLEAAGSSPEGALRADQRRLAALVTSVGNVVTSMRRISAIGWPDFVEGQSAVEAALRQDPAAVYPLMDFATRDRYRHVIERLAARARRPEPEVAHAAVARAAAAVQESTADRRAHVGYYLIDAGRPVLEAALRYRPAPAERLARTVQAHTVPFYLGLVGATGGAAVGAAVALARRRGGTRAQIAATVAATALPATNLAVNLVNYAITNLLKPYVLPKLELKEGIPAGAATCVVIPVLLTDDAEVRETLDHLEVLYLANHDPNLHYVLLSDFPDAPAAEEAADAGLLRQAVLGIEALNTRYGGADRFYLLHRRRRWNPQEGAWMGWERKRGKLVTFNRLLRGRGGEDFTTRIGDLAALADTKYVITLDADTQLPPEAARRLIGTLAHPLNRAELDTDRRVVRGYGILQPRVAVTVTSAAASPFARILAGHTGVDPYTTAISDLYQDLFRTAIYIGKGIYDVDAFTAAAGDRFPENTLLSHDLLEGAYARAGLVSDIVLYEDQPARYSVYALRQDRWIRGDWQILRWLGPRVRDARGASVRNPLPALARWQILDNLRRSVTPIGSLGLLVAGWTILPGPAAAWTVAALFVRSFPLLAQLVTGLPRKPAASPWGRHVRFVLHETAVNGADLALGTILVPDQALVSLQAAAKALSRMLVTHRRLLEWRTAASAQRGTGNGLRDYLDRMARSWVLSLGAGLLGRRTPAAWPVLAAWAAAPFVAWRISRPIERQQRPLTPAERVALRRAARMTWRYFADFIGPDDGWLAPDNYQEVPLGVLARRTSPTNLSLALLASLAAHDFGYLSLQALGERLDRQLAGMERLERYRGHLFNWYDTATGDPLVPRYISTVDSGNLAAHLLVLKQGCLARVDAALFAPPLLAGLADTAALLAEEIAQAGVAAELQAALAAFQARLAPAPADLAGWIVLLDDLGDRATHLAALAAQTAGAGPRTAELRYWAQALAVTVRSYQDDAGSLFGWVAQLSRAPAALAAAARDLLLPAAEDGDAPGAAQAVGGTLPVPSPAANLTWCARRLPAIRVLRNTVHKTDLDPAAYAAALAWVDDLHDRLAEGWTASERLVARLRDLARRAEQFSAGMRFDFLFDPDRKLFTIGYNVADGRRDNSYYDLLASEARLASFLAVARGDVPLEHWFQLGRAVTTADGSQALVSWTGTMFEYLMPNLVMPSYPGTLLDQTALAVVGRQREYGREQGVPWGISESAFNLIDASHTYQYRAFGVPGLGLKRGLADDLVIAPYATMLALCVDPPAAVANLRALARQGLAGRYGYYDAIDYTSGRQQELLPEGSGTSGQSSVVSGQLPGGKTARQNQGAGTGGRRPEVVIENPKSKIQNPPGAVVRIYMVHHQGMSLLALDNALHNYPLARWFLDEPLFHAATLLLQERIPREVPLVQPAGEVGGARPSRQPESLDLPGDDVQRFGTAATPQPLAHLVSNGTYTVMLTNAGGGFSRWRKDAASAPIAVTRWHDDATRDSWGTFCYIRDTRSGQVWSAGYAPRGGRPADCGGEWTPGRAELWRRDHDVEVRTTVVVSPDEDVEVRRISLVNHSTRPREIEVTSYAEVVLGPADGDLAHPAFQKLFVETEARPELAALLAMRRPRSAKDASPWLVHVLAVEGDLRGDLEYETDRARFLGRGHSPADPAALAPGAPPLSGSAGAVLDPILSLRHRVRLAPGATARFTFATGVAETHDAALALASSYQDPAGGARALRLADTYARIQLQGRALSPAAAMRAIRLASRVLFPDPALRPAPDVLARNTKGQPGLWAYGISGDLPILLVVVGEPGHAALVREVAQAHAYWRALGLAVDVVVLNAQAEGYLQPAHDALREVLEHSPAAPYLDQKGGVYLRAAAAMTEEDKLLFYAAARVVLFGRRGSLSQQLDPRPVAGAREEEGAGGARENRRARGPVRGLNRLRAGLSGAVVAPPPPRPPPARPAPAPEPGTEPPSREALPQFDNGLGGFSADGREYIIRLAAGEWTPVPWTNVLANPEFGCLVSEGTPGSTWSVNSRENRLTPWSNDPVSDTPADVLYLYDEASGALWTPAPLPIREVEPYTIRHGQGYTVYEHTSHGLAQELALFVPPDAPVRVARLTLRNPGPGPRRISATNYVEWVLGVDRDPAARFVITAWDAAAGALTARNPYNNEFADRLAFLAAGAPGTPLASHAYTADRATFLGRNGGPAAPAALLGGRLDSHTGAGLDPCAALQVTLDLPAGATATVAFFLGETADADEMQRVLAGLRDGATAGVDVALAATRAAWDELLGQVQVETPDPALDLLLNRWLLYQALACRIWARSSFYQGGGAYGYRDQLQDVLALVFAAPQITRAQIVRAAGRQFPEGDVQHWWHPPTGRGIRTRISDDVIWLPFVTASYVEETQDTSVLDERLPFLDQPPLKPGEEDAYSQPGVTEEIATVYEHCVRALRHGATQGPHGLPLMGTGDWNDGMNRVGVAGRGESVWLGWFVAAALARFALLADARGDAATAGWCRAEYERLRSALHESAWDGAWYLRAFFDDGTPLGSHTNDECRIDSIAQSWAVLSGAGDPERARQAMASLEQQLIRPADELVLLLTPPFDQGALDPGYIKGYVPGIRENGGQYTHGALWAGFAYAALRDGDHAHGVFALLNPIHHARDAAAVARYKVEPYVIVADVYAHPAHIGRGGWPWYTGSAAWCYRLGLQSILGLHRAGAALRLDPTIPPAWPGFRLVYRHSAATYTITVDNASHAGHGVTSVTLDGVPLPDGHIPLDAAAGQHTVVVRLGAG